MELQGRQLQSLTALQVAAGEEVSNAYVGHQGADCPQQNQN